MSTHYEGWGEHHAYRCGKDDGFTDGYFAAVEACIAAVEGLPNVTLDDLTYQEVLAALKEVQP